MRNLEATLGVQLFDRSAHQTRLTWAGQVFLGECRRVLATVEQAVSAAKAAAQGYQGYLRIAICDSLAQPQIATLMATAPREPARLIGRAERVKPGHLRYRRCSGLDCCG